MSVQFIKKLQRETCISLILLYCEYILYIEILLQHMFSEANTNKSFDVENKYLLGH